MNYSLPMTYAELNPVRAKMYNGMISCKFKVQLEKCTS